MAALRQFLSPYLIYLERYQNIANKAEGSAELFSDNRDLVFNQQRVSKTTLKIFSNCRNDIKFFEPPLLPKIVWVKHIK